VFTPDGAWQYDTRYEVTINPGVKTAGGAFLDRVYRYSFTTVPLKFALNVPIFKQQNTFACFSAAAKMVLGFYGINMSEEEIRGQIGYDPTERNFVTNRWGDPNKGIVGTVDGSGEGGYGAHWQPVADMLASHRQVEVKRNWNVPAMLAEVKAGHPVMVWWGNGVWPARELNWRNSEGEPVRAVNGMHVEVVKGWTGDQNNPDLILTNDPWRGERQYDLNRFLSLWKWFDNTGVIVK